jgi:hypothetical protein
MFNNKIIQYLSTLAALVITIAGAYVAIDNHYAKAEDVKNIQLRLDQKIVADKSDQLQNRIWQVEDRYPDKTKIPAETQIHLRTLKKDLETNDMMLRQSIRNSR